jgi:hypothetical protein
MWDEGYSYYFFSIEYKSALCKNKLLLLTTNINTEYVYWADNGNIFSSFKKLSA